MNAIITAVCVILVFGTVIFVHELGHFITAKLFKVKVHEFALGMGPSFFSKEKNGTLYSVRAFPIGGYVKMEGEDGESTDENAFNKKKPYKRLIILLAGAVMNFILGFLLLTFLIGFSKNTVLSSNIIESVPVEYEAYKAGIRENDEIISINSNRVRVKSDIALSLKNDGDNEIVVKRNGEKIIFNVPLTEIDGNYYLGVLTKSLDKTPLNVIKYSYSQVFSIIKLTYSTFFDMFKGEVSVGQMSGPVGIVTEISSAAKRGFSDVIYLLTLITLNLGVVNLFPLPALDGGRIVFVLYEMITRKKIKPEFESMLHLIGFAVLIIFMIYITKNDIMKLF